MSVSRGDSACLLAKARSCRVETVPRVAASSIILANPASRGRSATPSRQDFNVAYDDGENVVEVVGDAAMSWPTPSIFCKWRSAPQLASFGQVCSWSRDIDESPTRVEDWPAR